MLCPESIEMCCNNTKSLFSFGKSGFIGIPPARLQLFCEFANWQTSMILIIG